MEPNFRILLDRAEVRETVQRPKLVQAVHWPLVVRGIRRRDVPKEGWDAEGNVDSDEKTITIEGTYQPRTQNMVPDRDPTPRRQFREQYKIILKGANDTIDLKWRPNALKMANLIVERTARFAASAAWSLDLRVRDRQHAAATSGHGWLTRNHNLGESILEVNTVFGFHEARTPESQTLARPSLHQPVSASNPLSANVAGEAVVIIGVTLQYPQDPYGPGTLQLLQPLAGPHNEGDFIRAENRSRLIRAGQAATERKLTANDIITLGHLAVATQRLGLSWVSRYPGGYYHAYADKMTVGQLATDPRWDAMTDNLPAHAAFRDQNVGGASIYGVRIFEDDLAPSPISARRTAMGDEAPAGAENVYTQNDQFVGGLRTDTGQPIHHMLVCGSDAFMEHYQESNVFMAPEDRAISAYQNAGVNVSANNILLYAEHIKFIWGVAQNRLADKTTFTWQWFGAHSAIPDSMTGDKAKYKRQVVIQHVGTEDWL